MRVKAWRVPVVAAVAIVAWAVAVSSQSAAPITLEQGWSERDRTMFYTTSQGSQLLPYSWYLALEQPGGGAPFNADHLARYGYLENRDVEPGQPAARIREGPRAGSDSGSPARPATRTRCASATTTWRIDGGPTDADTWAFLFDLGVSLAETAASPSSDRFKRFAAKVNTRTKTPEAAALRRAEEVLRVLHALHRLEPHRRPVGPGAHRRLRHDLQPRHRHRPQRLEQHRQAERAGEHALPVGHPLARRRAVERLGAEHARVPSPRPQRGRGARGVRVRRHPQAHAADGVRPHVGAPRQPAEDRAPARQPALAALAGRAPGRSTRRSRRRARDCTTPIAWAATRSRRATGRCSG